MMNPEQAITAVVTLIGGGGATALGVAWLGYLTAARQGRKPEEGPMVAYAGLELQATALQPVATHLCRIAAIMEVEADERWNGKNFRDLVSDRMGRFQVDDVKGSAGLYTTESRPKRLD